MKQSEMLDVILRYLYERRNVKAEFSIAEILKESNIQTDESEIGRLANQLKVDKLIELNVLSQKLKKARITSKGITYCEENSHAKKGESIVNNYNIINSPQANLVVHSSQVTINQQQYEKASCKLPRKAKNSKVGIFNFREHEEKSIHRDTNRVDSQTV